VPPPSNPSLKSISEINNKIKTIIALPSSREGIRFIGGVGLNS